MDKNTLIDNTIYDKYINPKKPIALWISWWPDSVFATYTLIKRYEQKKYDTKNIHLIYCDHNTRKHNEAQFIQENFWQQTTLHIVTRPWTQKKIDEERLRKRRYKAFAEVIQKIDAQALVLWHNLTDRIETTFLNLLRGCHIDGFISMEAYTPSHHLLTCPVIRPLLEVAKPTIEILCKKQKINHIIDPSNKDNTKSKRNVLRNEVLPKLYNMAHKNTKTENTFRTSMRNIYNEVSSQKKEKINIKTYDPHPLFPQNKIQVYNWKIEKITATTVKNICKKLHIQNNITSKNLKEIVSICHKKKWHVYINKTYFFISHNKLYLLQWPKEFWKQEYTQKVSIQKPWPIKIEWIQINIEAKEYIWKTLCFAQKEMKYKWKSRTKRCINQKIPIFRRNVIPLVVDDKNNKKIIHAFTDTIPWLNELHQ